MKRRFFGTAEAEAEEEEVGQQGLAGGVMEGGGAGGRAGGCHALGAHGTEGCNALTAAAHAVTRQKQARGETWRQMLTPL
jgi:hypothetical protein